MNDRRVVWILGAGFSRSLGAPLLPGLLTRASAHRILHVYKDAFRTDAALCLGVSLLYEAGAANLRHSKPVESQWEDAEDFLERLALAREGGPEETSLLAFAKRTLVFETARGREDDRENEAMNALNNTVHADGAFAKLHACAMRMLAAECCCFLEGLVPDRGGHIDRERWDPYVRWASALRGNDCVLTFNYDRVPDLLARYSKHIQVALPSSRVPSERLEIGEGVCPVLKLHGSVDWIWKPESQRVEQADPTAALRLPPIAQVLATPGPTKKGMVFGGQEPKGGVLRQLWDEASRRIADADALVFLGYRMPATDSFSRRWLLDALRANRSAAAVDPRRRNLNGVQDLMVHTVLGDDTNHPHSRRLKGLLERHARSIRIVEEPMFAEDFLAVVDRNTL